MSSYIVNSKLSQFSHIESTTPAWWSNYFSASQGLFLCVAYPQNELQTWKTFLALLDYVSRAHDMGSLSIVCCPSSVSQLSRNLLSRFLSNFSCRFPWAIPQKPVRSSVHFGIPWNSSLQSLAARIGEIVSCSRMAARTKLYVLSITVGAAMFLSVHFIVLHGSNYWWV